MLALLIPRRSRRFRTMAVARSSSCGLFSPTACKATCSCFEALQPTELPELVARIKAVLRRSAADPGDSTIAVDGLDIDPAGFTVRRGEEEIALTATEFKLLLELARRPKQVFTRELLLELVGNYDYLGDSRLVDAAVQRLRGKIEADPKEPKLIRTVRGVGYRFDPS